MSDYRKMLLVVTFAIFGISKAACQSCPNWSSKFDRLTNKDVVAKLKQTNWDEAITASGGPEAVIAASKVSLKDAQQRLDKAKQAAIETSADGQFHPMTWDECKQAQSANAAATCEYLNMSEMILTLQGTIELASCRQ